MSERAVSRQNSTNWRCLPRRCTRANALVFATLRTSQLSSRIMMASSLRISVASMSRDLFSVSGVLLPRRCCPAEDPLSPSLPLVVSFLSFWPGRNQVELPITSKPSSPTSDLCFSLSAARAGAEGERVFLFWFFFDRRGGQKEFWAVRSQLVPPKCPTLNSTTKKFELQVLEREFRAGRSVPGHRKRRVNPRSSTTFLLLILPRHHAWHPPASSTCLSWRHPHRQGE